jgi:hypothetical protein
MLHDIGRDIVTHYVIFHLSKGFLISLFGVFHGYSAGTAGSLSFH